MPGLRTLLDYQPSWALNDLVAGLVLTTMLVPVGIAYAEASGVPGIYGLYATIIPLLAYAVFGPSRIMVLGPDSSLAAVILAVVLPRSGGDPTRAVALAGMMAIVSGVICILAGLFRLGFITELLSKPIRYGYMNGIALTVLISQLPKMFGISIESAGPLRDVWRIAREVLGGNANWTTFMISAGTFAVILLLKRFKRISAILIAVAAATIAVGVFDLAATAGVKVLGQLPQGLPSFAVPWVGLADLGAVIIGGLRGRTGLVRRHECPVPRLRSQDPDFRRSESGDDRPGRGQSGRRLLPRLPHQQQFLAHPGRRGLRGEDATHRRRRRRGGRPAGCVRAQLDAKPAYRRTGGCSDLVGPGSVRVRRSASHLPHPTLGILAVDCVPRRSRGPRRDSRHRDRDCHRRHRVLVGRLAPHSAVLGRVDGIRGYHDLKRYPDARLVPGLVIFRWDAPLFFANAELFQEQVLEAVAASPTPVRQVIVTAEPVTSVDVTSADMLAGLDHTLEGVAYRVVFR